MSNQAEVSLAGDNRLVVKGCLDVGTVASCRTSGSKLMADLDGVVVDLSETRVSGSAAIALLIAWQREARRLAIDIEIQHPPENLVEIAEACGVREILPFSS